MLRQELCNLKCQLETCPSSTQEIAAAFEHSGARDAWVLRVWKLSKMTFVMPEKTMALEEIELLRDSICKEGDRNYLIVSMY